MYDGDVVALENMPVSWFDHDLIGEEKAVALASQVKLSYGIEAFPVSEEYDNQVHFANVAVVSTDNMHSRQKVFSSIVNGYLSTDFLVDFRVGSALGEMYIVDLSIEEQAEEYSKSLDNEDSELPCGEKAYPGITQGWVSMMMCAFVMRFSRSLPHPFWQYTDLFYGQNLTKYVGCEEKDTMPERMSFR